MSAFPLIAAEQRTSLEVSFVPIATTKPDRYSITVSALATSIAGSVIPIAFAVFKLTTSSFLVGCFTGISPGLVRRKISQKFRRLARTVPGNLAHKT
jgi:hypothetical protein